MLLIFFFYFQFSTTDEQSGAPDQRSEKRRSFLQQPKSYVSKLPAPGSFSSSGIPKSPEIPQSRIPEPATPKTLPIPIPQISPTGQNSLAEQIEPQEFFIGDRVSIGGVKTGTLLYFGPTHIASGLWCGIALDEPEGIHDGFVNDVRYFTCRKGHGIFAPVDKVSHLDTKIVQSIIKASPKVSQIPGKIKVCQTNPISEEILNIERSDDLIDEDQDEEDVLGLDENGIIHDGNVDKSVITPSKGRRKLPKLPRGSSHAISKLQYLRKDVSSRKVVNENIIDIAAEKLQKLTEYDNSEEMSEANKTFTIDEKYETLEHQHSAGGSSGGEDSWSLSKDYLTMCDGKAQYLNITFDGESESKTSTQEASEEESPSPEFIFDQEMIEDGEFATEPIEIEMSQPMEMSRDSSLGLISSFALDKNDLLCELFGDDEEDELVTSQETLEPMSEEKISSPEKTPERQTDYDTSVDLEDGEADIVTSTPYVSEKASVKKNLNETVTLDDDDTDEPSQILDEVCANLTYTQENENNSSQKTVDIGKRLSDTFTLEEKKDVSIEVCAAAAKGGPQGHEPMVDSGISMKGSMSDSGNYLKTSMADSGVSMKGSLVDPSIRRSMLDSGISVQQSAIAIAESAHSVHKVEISEKVKGDESVHRVSFEQQETCVTMDGKVNVHMIHSEMDDNKLVKDLTDGHQRKERPISFLSTTSADTGKYGL